MKSKNYFFAFVLLFLLSSCVETVVATAVIGSSVVLTDGALFDLSQESRIETATRKAFKNSQYAEELKNIDIDVYNGTIMLTGYVTKNSYKNFAVQEAKQVKPNIKVFDEIMIFSKDYKTSSINDGLLSSQISLKLKTASKVDSSDYKYNVVDSIVFVMGKSDSVEEFNNAIKVFRTTKGVKKVVSYIVVVDNKKSSSSSNNKKW